jgi:leucyl aminopeptidase
MIYGSANNPLKAASVGEELHLAERLAARGVLFQIEWTHNTAGVMSDHDALCKGWLAAAQRAGEDMWRLPLNPRLREQLKSAVADMRNTGDRFGGAITAGLFLKTFAKDTPWVHVDLAGPASLSSSRPSQPRGGTGFAVASIVEYLARA